MRRSNFFTTTTTTTTTTCYYYYSPKESPCLEEFTFYHLLEILNPWILQLFCRRSKTPCCFPHLQPFPPQKGILYTSRCVISEFAERQISRDACPPLLHLPLHPNTQCTPKETENSTINSFMHESSKRIQGVILSAGGLWLMRWFCFVFTITSYFNWHRYNCRLLFKRLIFSSKLYIEHFPRLSTHMDCTGNKNRWNINGT